MEKDQGIGVAMFVGAILGIIIYLWLIVFWNPIIILQITAAAAFTVLLAILAWIGWTMAKTPPPTPIEPEVASSPMQTEGGSETKPDTSKSS